MRFSNSKIQCYKTCRKMYERKYIDGMKWTGTTEALEQGKSYHEAVGKVLTSEIVPIDCTPKTRAMARAFMFYIAPRIPERVVELEKPFEYVTDGGHSIIGCYDGITESGAVIEHKTTSADVNGDYRLALENNEQTLTYMLASGKHYIYYTIIKKPTIRQKANETDEQFEERCFEWYSEQTDSKISFLKIQKTPEELKEFAKLQSDTVNEIANCNLFYKNPNSCNRFNRMCEYFPICDKCDKNEEYENFQHVEHKKEVNIDDLI